MSETLSPRDRVFRQLNSAYQAGYPFDQQGFLTAIANLIVGGEASQSSSNPAQPSEAIGNPSTGLFNPAAGALGVAILGAEAMRVVGGSDVVNRVEVTGVASANPVLIAAAGSDTNIQLNISSKGTSNISLRTGGNQQVLIINTTSATNSVGLTGSTASNPVQIAVQGGTNIPIVVVSRGTGSIQFATQNTAARVQFEVGDTAGTVVNFVRATGNVTTAFPIVSAQGSDTNINLRVEGKGTGSVDLSSHLANFLRVSGAATTISPIVAAAGADANINLRLQPKGTGTVDIGDHVANFLRVAGAATTLSPNLSAQGSDANIDLTLTPKGTGQLNIAGTAATAAVSAAAFSATSRIQVKVNGTSFWIPASSASW
ncbi:hypothetical protein UFOVP1414_58 [uncultured Caudovirales phage]|uniref:Uncharacterized protein n=1 Tax=uncultured Caudovirales phage TaxID=2100421 RepID=A0A6J5SDY3_9CAUD|nr:hypothetical protein UFOVP442_19 [uncultured Caudovirales phage]CAB4211955.1 hypothetical protein UFOVP1414_58 [uncultured Caudovirales phage]